MIFLSLWPAWCASLLPQRPEVLLSQAEGAVVARILYQHSTTIGGEVFTRFACETLEPLRGTFPEYFSVHTPGGVWGPLHHYDSIAAKIPSGADVILMVNHHQGTLRILDGFAGTFARKENLVDYLHEASLDLPPGGNFMAFADLGSSLSSSVSSTGFSEDSNGNSRRFSLGDLRQSIPVIADISTLPNGITSAQALTALENAMTAWEEASSVLMHLEGTEVFAQPVTSYGSADGLVIRVNFSDPFDQIDNTSNTLGRGGSSFSTTPGSGGTVGAMPFNIARFGFVYLEHTRSFLEDAVNLEEVLTHELGHVLGLDHSSETSNEPNSFLANATMYFQAHGSQRGSTLGSWDEQTIVKGYPTDNIPPGVWGRTMLAVTKPNDWDLQNPEVNQITLSAFDTEGQTLTPVEFSASNDNGTFSRSGSTLTYTPAGYYGDVTVGSPTASYDQYEVQYSDGTHLSAPQVVRIIGFREDTDPAGNPDGLPDSWNQQYFGTETGPGPTMDSDQDGLTNLQEFLLGTNPNNASSVFGITGFSGTSISWSSVPYGLYAVETAASLTAADWSVWRMLSTEDQTSLELRTFPESSPEEPLFFRVQQIR